MNRPITVLFVLMIHTIVGGQDATDTLQTLRIGIYLTAEDFIKDTPIGPLQIQTGLNRDEINFYHLLFKEPEVRYSINAESAKVSSGRVWGYYDGKAVYLNKNLFKNLGDMPDKMLKYSLGMVGEMDMSNHMFTPINFLGTICYVHYIKVQSQGPLSGTTTSTKQYLFDTRTKRFIIADLQALKRLMADDPQIVAEFKKFKGKKEVKFHTFLRKYNERHPLTKA